MAVGLTLIEALADVEVNVPGVMAILVAPVVAQLSVLLTPEFMVVGAAVKEVIAGADPVLEDWFNEGALLQPASSIRANSIGTIVQRFSPEDCGLRKLCLSLPYERADFIRPPFNAVEYAGVSNRFFCGLDGVYSKLTQFVSGHGFKHPEKGERAFSGCGRRVVGR